MTTGSGATDKAPIAATVAVKGDRKPLVYCGVAKPIRWSKSDTPETIEQAKIENAKWVALCGNPSAVPAKKPQRAG